MKKRRYICVDPKATRTIDKSPRVKEINFYDRTHPSNFFHTLYAEKKRAPPFPESEGPATKRAIVKSQEGKQPYFPAKRKWKNWSFLTENFIYTYINFDDKSPIVRRRKFRLPTGRRIRHVYIMTGWVFGEGPTHPVESPSAGHCC